MSEPEAKPKKKSRRPGGDASAGDAVVAEVKPARLHPLAAKFELRTVHRSQVHEATYNPRTIDLSGQVKLKNILREFGLVEPLIWNETTGNLVGGHQRLKIMDQDMGHQDYTLQVSVVHLDATGERELNVALNNPGAQGWWDHDALAKMIAEDKSFDVELAGFDKVALKMELDNFADLNGLDLTHVFGDGDKDDDAAADAETIRDMQANKEEYKEVAGGVMKEGFYVQLVFGTITEKERFCAAAGLSPNVKVADGRQAAAGLKVDIGYEPPPDPE